MNKFYIHLFIILIALISACGDSDKNDKVPGGLSVVSSSPADNTTAVEPSSAISVVFSKPISAETVTATSFMVSDSSGTVAGSIVVSDTTATFTPTDPYGLFAPLTVTLSTDIRSIDQSSLPAAQVLRFTTRDGAWADTVELTDSSAKAFPGYGVSPALVVDAHGAATLSWANEADTVAQTAYSTDGKTWNTTSHGSGATSTGWLLAADAVGHVHFVWSIGATTNSQRFANGVWQDIKQVPSAATHLAAGLDGVPYVAVIDSNSLQVSASRFDGNTWSALIPGPTTDFLQMVTIQDGALVAWAKNNNNKAEIATQRFTGSQWVDNGSAVTDALFSNDTPFYIASDGQKRNLVVYLKQESNTSKVHFYATRQNDGAWGDAELIGDTDAGDVTFTFFAAMSKTGRAVALWEPQVMNGGVIGRYANIFDGNKWLGALKITGAEVGFFMTATIDDAGNAFVAWQDSSTIYIVRYNPATNTWSTPIEVPLPQIDLLSARLASNARGQAYLAWSEKITIGNNPAVHRLKARAFR